MKPDFKYESPKTEKADEPCSAWCWTAGEARGRGVGGASTDALAKTPKFLRAHDAPDPPIAAPELVGREIRNQLDAAGVRERDCVVGLPLKWVLTAQTELPPLPEADAASLLQMEAEKGFHADTETLQIANSRSALADGKSMSCSPAFPARTPTRWSIPAVFGPRGFVMPGFHRLVRHS